MVARKRNLRGAVGFQIVDVLVACVALVNRTVVDRIQRLEVSERMGEVKMQGIHGILRFPFFVFGRHIISYRREKNNPFFGKKTGRFRKIHSCEKRGGDRQKANRRAGFAFC